MLDELVPRLKKHGQDSSVNYLVAGLGQACACGSRVAFERLITDETNSLEQLDLKHRKNLLGLLVTGAGALGEEQRALDALELFFGNHCDSPSSQLSPKDQAFFLNQKQRLLHAIGRIDESFHIGERVLSLDPDDISYLYNQALNTEALYDANLAARYVDRYMNLVETSIETGEKPDDDHLRLAYRIYGALGREQSKRRALELLRLHHPIIAETLED